MLKQNSASVAINCLNVLSYLCVCIHGMLLVHHNNLWKVFPFQMPPPMVLQKYWSRSQMLKKRQKIISLFPLSIRWNALPYYYFTIAGLVNWEWFLMTHRLCCSSEITSFSTQKGLLAQSEESEERKERGKGLESWCGGGVHGCRKLPCNKFNLD